MDNPDTEFLPAMVGILKRLQITSTERGHSMLAAFLDMAHDEAEQLLRHEEELARLKATLEATSSRHSWRAGDYPFLAVDFDAEDEVAEPVAA
jgi:hypothetical protein